MGWDLFFSERKTKKNETQRYVNRSSGTQSKRLAGIQTMMQLVRESVSVREKGKENERETKMGGRKGAASIKASVPAGS